MVFEGKQAKDLTEADIQSLIGASEDMTLDFKKVAYKDSDADSNKWRAEFCADVSSFANARGGWIICGIREEPKGVAAEIVGIKPSGFDDDIIQLTNMANTGIDPRIPELDIHVVDCQSIQKSAMVIRIPRSFAGPHQVKEPRKFWLRRPRNKQEMDAHELRAAFNLSETWTERLRAFHKSRIDALTVAGSPEIPVPVSILRPRIALHVLPLTFADVGAQIDLTPLEYNRPKELSLHPILRQLLPTGRFNYDGYVMNAPDNLYIQVFRTGVVEFIDDLYIKDERAELTVLENTLLKGIDLAFSVQRPLAVALPLIVMISLINPGKVRLAGARTWNHYRQGVYEEVDLRHRVLGFPDVLVQSFAHDPHMFLRPVFDVLWNTVGIRKSLSYNDLDSWIR